MGFLAFIILIYIAHLIMTSLGNKGENSSSNTTINTERQRRNTDYYSSSRSSANIRQRAERESFRPNRTKSSNTNIVFNDNSSKNSKGTLTQSLDISGLNDAFTGAPLQKSLGLYQCQSCQVYYHSESFNILKEANSSQCVACSSTNIINILGSASHAKGRNHNPNVVTLSNYKQYVGSVVTFEGYVCKVNESRRGNDFAVMFEDFSWSKGFKLVFFRDAARRVGGASYIKNLSGRKIKVRGLIVNHPTFGYQIIISQKSMILSVN